MVPKTQRPGHSGSLGHQQTTLTGLFKKRSVASSRASPAEAPSPGTDSGSSESRNKRRRLSGPETADDDKQLGAGDGLSLASPNGRLRGDSPVLIPPTQPREIPDSEAGSEDEDIQVEEEISTQKTDIEQSLAPIKTDKEAIEEYEALRAAGQALDLHERLGSRKWVQGKSSIYVDAFNLALETVLAEETHLFNDAEMGVFASWKGLSYEAQYLYVRLFLRKTDTWHRVSRLGYYSDIADMDAAAADLFKMRDLPMAVEEEKVSPGELDPPEGTVLGQSFSFADCSDEHITSLEEASTLLLLDELKVIAKEAKLLGKNKSELLKALKTTSSKQTGLGFANLKRSDTEESSKSIDSDGREDSPNTANREEYYLRKIMTETGQCIRVSAAAFKLFERVHLVFYRSTQWTEKSLTTIILARISHRNFPEYIVSRSANIFPSRSLLLEFEASLRTQFRVDNLLEFSGTPTKDSFEEIIGIFEDVYPRWKVLLLEEQRKEDSIYLSGEGSYLRRLSPAWVYTRIVHKGAFVLGAGKTKHHAREHAILCELIEQRLFHATRRGAWYQRKALLEEHYMAALTPLEGRTPDQQKKHWKQTALRTCEQGLQDTLVHLTYHHDLQKRVVKLERQLKIAKRRQHDFGHARLCKPIERTFYAVRVERPLSKFPVPASQRRISLPDAQNVAPSRRGAKTLWFDPADTTEVSIVSVEAMCLSRYRALGWRGFHTEGGILRTLFALLFYDVLFLYLPNVFQTPYQTCPLDLHTDAFFPSRMSEVNARLAEISNGEAERIVSEVWEREGPSRTCVVGLDWDFDVADVRCICRCFKGESLSAVMRVMCQEYAQRGGGVPDLFLWRECEERSAEDGDGGGRREQGSDVLFAEVKSENDRLSDTQRLWIHVLTGAGIKVELCNALASEVRVLDS